MLGPQTNTNKVVSKPTVQHIYTTIQSVTVTTHKHYIHIDRLTMEDRDYSSRTHNHKQRAQRCVYRLRTS